MQESGDLLGAQQIVLAAVEKQVGGTAEATATGTDKMNVKFGEMQEELGGKLLPVIDKLTGFFTKYMDILLPLGGVILGIVVAMKVWNVVQGLFNIIMAANPIVLVVLAIVALVAAVILAYNKVDWFRAFVDAAFAGVVAAFNWLKDAAAAVFGWVSDNWPLLLAILLGPFGIAIGFVVKHFDTIMSIIKGVIDWVRDNWQLLLAIITGPIGIAVKLVVDHFGTLKDAAMTVVNWVQDRFQDLAGFLSRIVQTFSSILGSIADAIKLPIAAATEMVKWVIDKVQSLADFISGMVHTIGGFASGIADAIKGPINAIIRAWNRIEFGIPGVDVGPVHFGGITIGTPDIPELARGGLVMRTGLALVHEGETFSGVGRSGSPQTVNITVQTTGLGADAPQIQRAVVHALRGYSARNGPLPPFVTGATAGAP
jgi:phage-related protein